MQGHIKRAMGLPGGYRTALMLGSILTSSIATPALAQSLLPDAPPVRSPQDENGVDLSNGKIFVSDGNLLMNPEITIGSPEHGEMRFSRILTNSAYWQHDYDLTLQVGTSQAYLYLGKVRRMFTLSSGTFTPDNRDGSTLVSVGGGNYKYTANDGTIVNFASLPGSGELRASSLIRPDGERQDFYYKTGTFCYPDPFGNETCTPTSRVQSVTSNLGYQLKLTYAENPVGVTLAFLQVTSAKLINNTIDYCDPTADSCSGFTQTWPELSFSSAMSGSNRIESVTDTLGRVTQFIFDSSQRLSGVKLPSSSSNDITISYGASDRVSSVAVPGRTTNYSWSLSGSVFTGVASDAVGTVRTTTADISTQVVLTDKDGLNRTTTHGYDSYGRRTSVLLPEGNKFEFTYDARGNLTQNRRKAKPGSGLADIVTTADYDASCTNPAKCNSPNWTNDALGNQTDYTYNTTTGQLLTVSLPAPTGGGTRPKTTFTYSSQYAWYKNSAGSIVQAATPVSKLATSSTCLTGATCAGTANEQKTTVAYQTGSASAASNLLPVSVNVKAGDNSVTSTRTMAHDIVGNVISIDGPLAGTGDTTAYRYDVLRRPVGSIGPDADGAGGLPNAAKRITYDTKGRVTTSEQGTTAGQTDTAWSNFAPTENVVTTYDDADRPLTETLGNGATSYALTQYGYDARGRLDCTTVRMNTAIYGSLPAACTLGTPGSHGNDRITKHAYNLANEVAQVQTAYGTAAVASEAKAYTPNGRTSYVVDANNNRTTYEYDGHDRLVKTRFPVATAGANSSSATDYEQLTYGDNVRVTSRRLRDGQSINYGYDNLNRLVTKDVPNNTYLTFDVTYSYDLLGRLTLAQDTNTHFASFSYDALGRKLTEGSNFYNRAYQYDAAGRRTRITHSDGLFIQYDYDTAGNMTAVRENGAASGVGVLAQYSYDSLGRRTGVTFGNGVSQGYNYDAVSRLSQLTLNLAGTVQDQTATFSHNPASQISQTTRANDSYAFTARYNVNRPYTANGLNQYTVSGTTSLGYDARGNLTSSGSSSYSYTAENRLVTFPGAANGYAYEPLGRLVWEDASTTLQYDGDQLLAELAAGGAVARRYVYGPGVDTPVVWYEGTGTADRRFLLADERGSIVAVTDASGGALAINRYDEYGIPQAGNLGRFQYTGQAIMAGAGLYYYKARMYSPTLGRFMQTDPIGYGDGMNWYNYVGGDPVNNVDPSGTSVTCYNVGLNCTVTDSGSSNSGSSSVNIVGTLYSVGKGIFKGVKSLFGGGSHKPKAPKVDAPQNGDFHYRVQDFAFCSADELFAQFSKPGNSAPDAPAARPGTTTDIPLAGGNPITQIVDARARTITNVTQDGHRYHSGTVEIRMTPTWYGSAVTIEGRGTGPHYLENRIGGALLFSALAARATISCTVGAD